MIGSELEQIRQQCGISVLDICNALGVSESEYMRIKTNKVRPTTYQLIMFICATRHPLPSI